MLFKQNKLKTKGHGLTQNETTKEISFNQNAPQSVADWSACCLCANKQPKTHRNSTLNNSIGNNVQNQLQTTTTKQNTNGFKQILTSSVPKADANEIRKKKDIKQQP